MGTKNDAKSRRQKTGTYYRYPNFVYGFLNHFRYPVMGPQMQRNMRPSIVASRNAPFIAARVMTQRNINTATMNGHQRNNEGNKQQWQLASSTQAKTHRRGEAPDMRRSSHHEQDHNCATYYLMDNRKLYFLSDAHGVPVCDIIS